MHYCIRRYDVGMTTSGPTTDAELSDAVDAAMLAARAFVGVIAGSLSALEPNLSLAHLRILVMVSMHDAHSVAEIADDLGVHQSNATRAIDRLVRSGHLHRAQDDTDRRRLDLQLTARGEDVLKSVMDRRRAALAHVLSQMPRASRHQLVPALEAFANAAGEIHDDGTWPT